MLGIAIFYIILTVSITHSPVIYCIFFYIQKVINVGSTYFIGTIIHNKSIDARLIVARNWNINHFSKEKEKLLKWDGSLGIIYYIIYLRREILQLDLKECTENCIRTGMCESCQQCQLFFVNDTWKIKASYFAFNR